LYYHPLSIGGVGHGHTGKAVDNAVSEAATATAHAGKAAAQEAGVTNLGQAVSAAVHDAHGKTGAQPGMTGTTPSATPSAKNMGQAVSTAAHTAKSQARADGTKVGPAVSAAVHGAQTAARNRDAAAEDRESGTAAGVGTRGTPPGSGASATTSTTAKTRQ
jgi:hypothetical protein